MSSLASMRKDESGLIVAAFVLAGRAGECDARRVVTAAESWREAVKRIRGLGYKEVDARPGKSAPQADESRLALQNPGAVYERPWTGPGPWTRVDTPW